MKTLLFLILLTFILPEVNAQEGLLQKTDDRFDSAVLSKRPPEPDHLVPETPYESIDILVDYKKKIQSTLKLNESFIVRFIFLPSCEAEYSIRLHNENNDSDITTSKKFFLTYVQAKESIWCAMSENNDEKQNKDVDVMVATLPFPSSIAKRLCILWDEMIFRTRIPRLSSSGTDGVTYEFENVHGYGKAWSPVEPKSPTLFVDLARTLLEYCKADSNEREGKIESIKSKIEILENYLKLH